MQYAAVFERITYRLVTAYYWTINLVFRRKLRRRIQQTIENTGLCMVGDEMSTYTIGNTDHNRAELFMWHDDDENQQASAWLRELSDLIAEAGELKSGTTWTIDNQKFSFIVMDRFYINECAASLRLYYGSDAKLRVLQIIAADEEGCFPTDPYYNVNFLDQPILRLC